MSILVPILWIVLGVSFLMYSVYGAILAYHWVRWGHSTTRTTTAIIVYAGTGIFLFLSMIGTITAVSLSS